VVEYPVNLAGREREDRAVEVDVLATGEVGMEAGAQLEQRGDPPTGAHHPRARAQRAGHTLEQGGLARAVVPEQADGLALEDRERHVVEGEELLGPAPAPDEALLQRPGAVVAQLEALGDPVDLDGDGAHYSSSPKSASSRPNSHSAPRSSSSAKSPTMPRRPRYQPTPTSSGRAPGSLGL